MEQEQPVDLSIPSTAKAAAGFKSGLRWLETQDIKPFKMHDLIQLAIKSPQKSLRWIFLFLKIKVFYLLVFV